MSSYNLGELARTLFEERGDALFLFEPDSERMLDVNFMAQHLSGFTRDELIVQPISHLFRSEHADGLGRLAQAYLHSGAFHSQEGFWLRHHQDCAWVPVKPSRH